MFIYFLLLLLLFLFFFLFFFSFLLLLLFLSLSLSFIFLFVVLSLTRYLSVTCGVPTETLAPRRTSAKTSILEEDDRCICLVIICSRLFVLLVERKQDCRRNYLPKRYSCQLLHTFKTTLLFLWQSTLSTTCLRSHPHVVESTSAFNLCSK